MCPEHGRCWAHGREAAKLSGLAAFAKAILGELYLICCSQVHAIGAIETNNWNAGLPVPSILLFTPWRRDCVPNPAPNVLSAPSLIGDRHTRVAAGTQPWVICKSPARWVTWKSRVAQMRDDCAEDAAVAPSTTQEVRSRQPCQARHPHFLPIDPSSGSREKPEKKKKKANAKLRAPSGVNNPLTSPRLSKPKPPSNTSAVQKHPRSVISKITLITTYLSVDLESC